MVGVSETGQSLWLPVAYFWDTGMMVAEFQQDGTVNYQPNISLYFFVYSSTSLQIFCFPVLTLINYLPLLVLGVISPHAGAEHTVDTVLVGSSRKSWQCFPITDGM